MIKGRNIFQKYKLMKAMAAYSIQEEINTYTYEYCEDRNFDDYNRPMPECPKIATAIGKNVASKLTVSLK